MAILNYSTSIPAEKTAGEIIGTLVKHGAKEITVGYDEKRNPVSISFYIATKYGDRDFRLPVNIDATHRKLNQEYQEGKIRERRYTTRDQAVKVAWRIIKDWIEAQLALIETEMATLDEIFLPYMISGNAGQTLYEVMQSRQLKLLPLESTAE